MCPAVFGRRCRSTCEPGESEAYSKAFVGFSGVQRLRVSTSTRSKHREGLFGDKEKNDVLEKGAPYDITRARAQSRRGAKRSEKNIYFEACIATVMCHTYFCLPDGRPEGVCVCFCLLSRWPGRKKVKWVVAVSKQRAVDK